MSASQKKSRYIDENWFTRDRHGVALLGSKCEACDKVFFPKKLVCPDCFDGKLTEIPLSRNGRLHTYAQAIMGPANLKKPYIMGFVDLPEKIKLYSLIVDCEPWNEVLKIGMDVELVVRKFGTDRHGNEIISYMFRPTTGGK